MSVMDLSSLLVAGTGTLVLGTAYVMSRIKLREEAINFSVERVKLPITASCGASKY